MAAAAILLAVGLRGLLGGGDELPPALRPPENPTPTPILQVIPSVTPFPWVFPTSAPTPTSSTAPVARVVIESLGVDAPAMILGLDKDFIPEVPTFENVPKVLPGVHPADVVAWYDFSSHPGHGSNAVFSGHVDWVNRLGVFGRLRNVKPGDVIQVFLADGTVYRYQVTDNMQIPWDDPEAVKLMLATEEEVITLITCGGTWVPNRNDPLGGNYTHRTIVRAARLPGGASPASSSGR